jgi:hypothetical protein
MVACRDAEQSIDFRLFISSSSFSPLHSHSLTICAGDIKVNKVRGRSISLCTSLDSGDVTIGSVIEGQECRIQGSRVNAKMVLGNLITKCNRSVTIGALYGKDSVIDMTPVSSEGVTAGSDGTLGEDNPLVTIGNLHGSLQVNMSPLANGDDGDATRSGRCSIEGISGCVKGNIHGDGRFHFVKVQVLE